MSRPEPATAPKVNGFKDMAAGRGG